MSRFFRSGESSSDSSDSESPSDDDHGTSKVDDQVSERAIDFDDLPANVIDRPDTVQSQDYRDFLLHALLEERCMNEVRASYSGAPNLRRPAEIEIQAEAKLKYQRLCTRLAPFNLISVGLEADRHTGTRRRYRDGLDYLGRSSTTTRVPPTLRRLLTEGEAGDRRLVNGDGTFANDLHNEHEVRSRLLPYPYRRLLTDVEAGGEPPSDDFSQIAPAFRHALGLRDPSNSTSVIESRYHSEFEELHILGRGGFGSVYHVKHRLDNQAYAIKKVPLSASHLHRIRERGEPALEELLRELRTLARLDHPNIVRYYTGWLEWIEATPVTVVDTSGGASEDAVLGATDLGSFGRVLTESEEDEGIVFEHSSSRSTKTATSHEEIAGFENVSSTVKQLELCRVGTKGTIATVSDETIESVGRAIEPSISVASTAGSINVNSSALVLHMQMSLHPLSLTDFLSPRVIDANIQHSAPPPLSHCFHLEPSISIMLALLDGIEHLHNEGIVHRDLKPSNIFMGQVNSAKHSGSLVNLRSCSDCHTQGSTTPIALEVRIGDFGLVSFTDDHTKHSEPVGTAMYRPATVTSHSPHLDVYALGIIAFELLWPFNTRMERLHCIQHLKDGDFPLKFADRLGCKRAATAVMDCIRAMIADSGSAMSISIVEIRSRLKSTFFSKKET